MQSKHFAFVAAAAIAALLAAGCTKGTDQSTTSSSTTTTTTATSAPVATMAPMSGMSTTPGDAAHGKTIFGANCATCHGAGGEGGGVGPSLKNEKSRKNFDKTVAWIKNPQPPMPKLFPQPLSEKDVADVAAYVQTL
jgi:mono/diheme cytochrome c family protein